MNLPNRVSIFNKRKYFRHECGGGRNSKSYLRCWRIAGSPQTFLNLIERLDNEFNHIAIDAHKDEERKFSNISSWP